MAESERGDVDFSEIFDIFGLLKSEIFDIFGLLKSEIFDRK